MSKSNCDLSINDKISPLNLSDLSGEALVQAELKGILKNQKYAFQFLDAECIDDSHKFKSDKKEAPHIRIEGETVAYIHSMIMKDLAIDYKIKVNKVIELGEVNQYIELLIKEDSEHKLSAFLIASIYARHILKVKAFSTGNKRTALAVALLYLSLNDIRVANEPMLGQKINKLDSDSIDIEELALFLQERSS